MGYVRKVLQPGETLVYEATLSWIGYLPGLLVLVTALIMFVVGGELFGWPLWVDIVAGLVALFGLWLLGAAWFERWTTEVAITDRRIIHKTGFIRRNTIEMSVEKVESVDVKQSLLGRIFDYGDVIVRGTGAGLAPLTKIDSPLTFRSKLIGTSHHLGSAVNQRNQD
jgi:uncharacterized membrane protein YdbT with pleckstrin-like domain